MKRIFVAAAFFVSLLLFGSAYAGNTIKVGVVDSFTGPSTVLARDVLDGLRLGVEAVNNDGGVLGKRIEIVTRDDRSRPASAFSLARELIEHEGVDMLAGTSNAASYLAVSDVCRNKRVPFFATGCPRRTYQPRAAEKGLRYIFHINETAEMAGRAAAIGLSTKNYGTYWIAGEDSEYGHALTESLWASLKRLKPGVRFIGQSWWKEGEREYHRHLEEIVRAQPDCVIVALASGIVDFQKAAASVGLRAPIYEHGAIDHSLQVGPGSESGEGVMGTTGYLFYQPETPANRAFVQTFMKAYHRYPGAGAFYGYVTARFVSEAYAKSKTADRERFVDALEGLTVETPSGSIEMRASDHQALLPVFFGVARRDKDYPGFLVAGDVITVTAREYGLPRPSLYARRPTLPEAPADRGQVADPAINHERPAPVDTAPTKVNRGEDIAAAPSLRKEQRAFGENDVAIVIGIEQYRKNLPSSPYSSNDAKAIKSYLEALGFAPRNVQYLCDGDATRSDIQKTIEGWLPNRVRPDSRVFIYYSGHGAPDPATGDAYLVPYDGDPQYLKETAYSLSSLYQRVAKLQVREVMVVLDTCFSGMGGKSLLAYGLRPLVIAAPLAVPPPNAVILTASRGSQVTASSQDKEFGIFTYYFLKAIKDGKRSMAEIYEYLEPLVEDEAKRLNVEQTPGIVPSPDKLKGRFLMARSGGRV